MSTKEYALKYGRGEAHFAPDAHLVAGELRIKEFPPTQDNGWPRRIILSARKYCLSLLCRVQGRTQGSNAGDYILAHLEGCRFVETVYGVPLPRSTDLVIASCGGYPKDIKVYQLQKTMDNAWLAVRE